METEQEKFYRQQNLKSDAEKAARKTVNKWALWFFVGIPAAFLAIAAISIVIAVIGN